MIRKNLIVAAFTISLLFSGNCQAKQQQYRTTRGFFKTNYIIQTKDGNLWKVSKKHKKGVKVKVRFNTLGTKTKKDDRIIKVQEVKR